MTQTSERSKPIRQHPTIGDSDLNPDNNQSIMNTTNSQASTSTSTSTSPVVTLSQRPTHKLSRSNSLSLSKKQTYNPHNRRPISPTKQSKPSSSPLIIHRSQSTSARTRPISLNFKSSTDITHTTNQPIRSATTSTSPTSHSDVSSQALTPFHNLDLEHLKHSLQPGNEDLGLQLTPQKNRRSSRTALSNQPETSIEELESIQEASPSICRTIENLEQPVNSLDSSRCTTATITTTTKQASTEAENITVCVRVRPTTATSLSDIDLDTPIPHRRLPSTGEDGSKRFGAWYIHSSKSSISLSPSHPIIGRRGTGTAEGVNGSEGYEFCLDKVFDPYSSTDDLFRDKVQSIVRACVLDGYNATVFAYGQTGSGKTFTMMGSTNGTDDEERGVIPRAVNEVFRVISTDDEREYLLRVSYLEIYNEVLKDLLCPDPNSMSSNKLTIHENNQGRVYVNGLREEVVSHPVQVLEALARGEKSRHVGATDWNERSSRSHTVFSMTVESRVKSGYKGARHNCTQISQLNLIDLAGSESAASSHERRKEGAFINRSLLALSTVISKLSKNEQHIPYRDSKLTRLLQTSLGGNAKVVVICAVSACADSVVETLSTLRFARRAKMVVTQAERGTVFDDQSALIQAYQREIMSLKSKLQQNSQALSNSISSSSLPVLAEINAEKSKAESELTNLRIERIKLQEQIEHLNRRILSRNNIEASIHQVDTSSRPRRIVSGQERGPKKFKGRVTDLGGMVGLIGIGLRPGYLNGGMADSENSTPVKDYNSLKQFQKEFRLEEEVKTLRRELDKLRKEKEQLSLSASSSTTSCIKSATPSLEDPKDVVQNSLHENLCEDVFGFKLCGAAPEQNFEKSQQPLEEIEENEERLLFQNSNRSVSTLCNDVKKHFNQNHREAKLAGTQTETVSDNNANQEFFLLETMLRNENKELEKKLSLLTIEHDELKAIQKSSLNKSQETPERPQTESGVSSAERDHTSAVQAELSQALDVISKLELEDKQKEVILKESTLENERLFEQLRKADERVKLLEEKSLERKKKIESDKRSISEKSKIFEARISELQALLDSERQAKKEADDELAARNDEYQAQIDLDLKLQKDLATLKTKLEKFEKKIAAERCKTNEKELEVMNIMQERDQLAHLLETQSLQLDNLAATHKQDADTLVAELEEMLLRSEATADELQKNNNKLSQARQLSESKLKEVREDISESKIKFDAMDDRQRTLVIENEELIKTVQKLNDDLIQSKSQDFFFADLTEKKIEERTNDAKMNLQRSFEFQLDQLKSKNSEMKTHILTLKNRLVAYEEAPPTRQTAAESMETIVDLQSVIEDQKKTIQLLREEAATAAIRPVNGSKRMLRDCDQSHHYNRYEVERLQNIIDEQEKRLSDAKTDLAKCQAHVRNQAEMIAKLQLNPDLFKKQTFEPRSIGRSSELISSSSFHPVSSPIPYRSSKISSVNSMMNQNYSPGPSKSAASNLLLEGSPKPLPVPENFGVEDDDEWRKRKNRRRTIEKDMAKLKDENVVERKRNVLLSSTPSSDSARKPKRVLSGISSRNNRLGRTPLSSDSNKEDFHSHSINFSERSQSSSNFSSQGYYE